MKNRTLITSIAVILFGALFLSTHGVGTATYANASTATGTIAGNVVFPITTTTTTSTTTTITITPEINSALAPISTSTPVVILSTPTSTLTPAVPTITSTNLSVTQLSTSSSSTESVVPITVGYSDAPYASPTDAIQVKSDISYLQGQLLALLQQLLALIKAGQ